jgi:hypothetical protein
MRKTLRIIILGSILLIGCPIVFLVLYMFPSGDGFVKDIKGIIDFINYG